MYKDVVKEMKERIASKKNKNGKPPIAVSLGDFETLAFNLINDTEHEVKEYHPKIKDDSGNPVVSVKKPSKRFREALKPMLKSMGIDSNEVNKIDNYKFSKEAANATADIGITILNDYLNVGRKFKFPITSKNESQGSIYKTTVEEKITKPNKFEINAEGKSIAVPSGKTIKTYKHNVYKVSNFVPDYLKKEI